MKQYNEQTAKPSKRYILKDEVVGVEWIMGYEPFFNKHVFVASISHSRKEQSAQTIYGENV